MAGPVPASRHTDDDHLCPTQAPQPVGQPTSRVNPVTESHVLLLPLLRFSTMGKPRFRVTSPKRDDRVLEPEPTDQVEDHCAAQERDTDRRVTPTPDTGWPIGLRRPVGAGPPNAGCRRALRSLDATAGYRWSGSSERRPATYRRPGPGPIEERSRTHLRDRSSRCPMYAPIRTGRRASAGRRSADPSEGHLSA